MYKNHFLKYNLRGDFFMRKKAFILIVIFMIFFSFKNVLADDEVENEEELSTVQLKEVSANTSDEPQINSRAAIVYDRDTNMVLYEKNINSRRAMASTTKIMTALVVLENSNLNDTVTVSKKAAGTGGSRLGLKEGDKISVNDLLYSLMLKSGNDAAVALAEYVGGSVPGFANKMNDKAKQLNLNDTNFVTPHGLDDEKHYTTVYSLAKLSDFALQNKKFLEIVKTKEFTVNINGLPKQIRNTNELLGVLDGVYGVKTGFTNNAGRCLVTATQRDGFNIIVVVLGADTKKFRTIDSVKLIEYTYKNFCRLNIKEKIDYEFGIWKEESRNKINVEKGTTNFLEYELENLNNDYITIRNNRKNSVKVLINSIKSFEAPLNKGSIVGTVKVYDDNKLVNVLNIFNKNNILKKNILDYYVELLGIMVK